MGVFDVVVGINLLREGLDLPEVSLVAILDADKEGFLRSDTALIQTVGRAARHIHGEVIMYADKITDSMRRAIDETNRRRQIQLDHNTAQGITPVGISKEIRDLSDRVAVYAVAEESGQYRVDGAESLPVDELENVIGELEEKMKEAAMNLEFETAAAIRDQIFELRGLIAEVDRDKPQSTLRRLAGRR
jgi:excinuclease ABC subunit B